MTLPQTAELLLDKLNQNGYEAFVVGGCVRDMLMGISPHDYDITTSATPQDVKRVFSEYHVIETGLKHGTVTVMADGEPYEITTYRLESTYSDSRHPDNVVFTSSLVEDLSRRDFTVNAIAFNPKYGIVDPFGGAEDIKKGILRCVGIPEERFTEDALRILRLLRFSSVLGFSVENETAKAAFSLKERLVFVSAERIAVELCKLLCGKCAGKVLLSYVDILGIIIPELLSMKGFEQKNIHHIYDVLKHTVVAVDSVPPEKALRLAALFHDIGKPSVFSLDSEGVGHFYGHASVSAEIAETTLENLKFDNATKNIVTRLVKWQDFLIEPTEKSVKRTLGKMTPEFFFMLIELKRADILAQNPLYWERQKTYDQLEALAKDILARQECFSLKDLSVNGHELVALGIRQGKDVGVILQRLLEAVINGDIPNKKNALLQKAKTIHKEIEGS